MAGINWKSIKPMPPKSMAMAMDLSSQGLNFIQNHEGFGKLVKDKIGKWVVQNPYLDSLGYVTAGYGHLVEEKHTTILQADIDKYKDQTKDDALKLLKKDVAIKVAAVNKLVRGISLNQYQFDAIVSFAFNVGPGDPPNKKHPGLLGSEFYKQLKKGNYDGNLMMHYCHPSEIKGRRQDEVNLFNWGVYSHITEWQLSNMFTQVV